MEGGESFFLLIGNAGGVEVTFDGDRLGPLGQEGQVLQVRFPAE
ncbi:MAG: RodZ domain-containing protein [Thermodesulfobacteriota bacterium]